MLLQIARQSKKHLLIVFLSLEMLYLDQKLIRSITSSSEIEDFNNFNHFLCNVDHFIKMNYENMTSGLRDNSRQRFLFNIYIYIVSVI